MVYNSIIHVILAQMDIGLTQFCKMGGIAMSKKTTPKKRSFEVVVWKHFSDAIEKAVSNYVEENFATLELSSYRVQVPDEAFLSHLSRHRVIVYDTQGNTLDFDVVVIADIEIFQQSRSDVNEGEARKWFRVSCNVEFTDGLTNFQIKAIDEYDHHSINPRKIMTDTLVPYIYAKDLEANAEMILAEVYPEALSTPTQIDVRDFAKRMGLKIKEARLSKNGVIFGQMIFHDCTIEYYDLDKRRFDTFDAEGGTIFVDPEVFFLRTLGSWNNTVIHECVHWMKHRKVFELERMYNDKVSRIMCRVSEATLDEQKQSDTDWMEWHANTLAPRVLMPFNPFKQKAEEIIASYKKQNPMLKTADIITAVIYELKDFFGVSAQAAKIRMIDIGYSEAIGVLEYIDDRYVPAHSFGEGKIGKNQTYSVPALDLRIQYAVNSEFQQLLDSGNFVYIDAHYCINDPKYITQNEFGILEMTDYAVKNMDECCLVFDRSTRPNSEFGAKRYTECALFQNAVSPTITDFDYKDSEHNKEVAARAAAMRAEQEEVKEAAKIMKQLTDDFGESLKLLMKWRGMTNESLAEKALVSSKTIQRYRNIKDDQACKLDIVVAVCLGLQLPPYISYPLIEKAGHKLKVGEKGVTYAHLLATHYRCTIYEFNEYLESAGYPPLSGDE
jgi:hypothetical protein